jgi:hypothetical protein
MNDILLINLNWRNLSKVGRMGKYNPLLPLELMYISASLDKEKIRNRIIDLWGLNKDINDFKRTLKEAEIVVLSSAPSYLLWRDGTINADLPKQKIKEIKKINSDIKLILIGPHGTVMPQTFFNCPVDYIVRGEPDLVTAKLIKKIITKKNKSIDGICFKENNIWKISKSYAFVNDLGKLPLTPFEKLDLKNYSWPKDPTNYKFNKRAVYETSRGCPFNCIFCFREGFRGRFRFKPLRHIKKEVEKLRNLKIEYIYLIDETFGVDKKWTKGVCKELCKNKIKWACETRPELLDNERVKTFIKTGCVDIQIGLESANNIVLKSIGKSTFDLKKLKKNVMLLIKNKIHVKFFCILGAPKETKKTIRETLNYIFRFPLDKVNATANIMLPYPNTKLWYLGIKEGKKLKNWNDVLKYAGIIDNNFKKPKDVMKEVARFNAKILKEQLGLKIISELKKNVKMNLFILFKYSCAYIACLILIIFPNLFNFFYRFYRFI